MPEVLDIFNNDAFSAASLTDAVNMVPNAYGRVNDLGIFTDEPVSTTSVVASITNGVLNLLPTRPRGAPASLGAPERQNLRSFVVPHIPHDDAVLATDVQNMLARAPNAGLDTVVSAVNRKLVTMRRKHAITLENLRVGALKGIVYDYDGTTVIYNWFTEFGVTQQSFDFVLGTAGTDVPGLCADVVGYMEDNLLGDTMTSVHALASPEWMKKFLAHPKVQGAFNFFNQANGLNPQRDNVRKMFPFQGIMFEEYRGGATKLNEDKTTTFQRFIPAGEVRFFPLGTTETFKNYWAPPDFVDGVNVAPTVDGADAQVFVAPLERMKFGKGMEIHTESNPLPICKRPALLVRGTTSN